MNQAIWKFRLSLDDVSSIKMPADSRIVHIHHQSGESSFEFMIWAMVDSNAVIVERHFGVFGTGHSIPECAKHLYTWFAGPYVWHLLELNS